MRVRDVANRQERLTADKEAREARKRELATSTRPFSDMNLSAEDGRLLVSFSLRTQCR